MVIILLNTWLTEMSSVYYKHTLKIATWKNDKTDKTEKLVKNDKADKTEKLVKNDKSDKNIKTDKNDKQDKQDKNDSKSKKKTEK